jgi:hypothetical protein
MQMLRQYVLETLTEVVTKCICEGRMFSDDAIYKEELEGTE